jgi:superfamily II DNA helicase RecQ
MYGYLLYSMRVMLTLPLVRRRLILVTIDELHLCTRQQWGGSFRPAMGKLDILRHRLPDHVPLLDVMPHLQRRRIKR